MILGFLESVNNYMTDYSKEILAVEKASINQLTEVVRYPSLMKEAIPFVSPPDMSVTIPLSDGSQISGRERI